MDMRYGVVAALCAILTGTTAAAQQTCGTREEILGTPYRDLNGTRTGSEQVVTHRSGTGDEHEVKDRIVQGTPLDPAGSTLRVVERDGAREEREPR